MTGPRRERMRAAIATIAMVVAGLLALYAILQGQRLRIPILEERPFELKAELASGEAITPGQGQSVRVAGVRIGEISKVGLEDGHAVVTMSINRDYLPIYRDATMLLRPATQLKDMFLELDPGSKGAGEFSDGDTIPLANTMPDVNLEEILDALDSDTQAYLRLLLVGGGQGLKGRGEDLGQVLANLGPMARQFGKLSKVVVGRRRDLARLIGDLEQLSHAVAGQDDDLARLVASSNSVLGAAASQDVSTERAIRLLPGALRSTRLALGQVDSFSRELGPASQALRPFARGLDDTSAALVDLAETEPVVREQLRPFTRVALPPVRDLGAAARPLARSTPDLTTVGTKLNRLFNLFTYNPRGAEPPGTAGRDEGYSYWAGWLAHDGNSVFQAQDAHGSMWRIYLTADCQSALAILAGSPLAPLYTGLHQLFGPGGPFEGGC
jgi:phospholipid/cholesterol/gamma-HCH transport system substrate-binding protein